MGVLRGNERLQQIRCVGNHSSWAPSLLILYIADLLREREKEREIISAELGSLVIVVSLAPSTPLAAVIISNHLCTYYMGYLAFLYCTNVLHFHFFIIIISFFFVLRTKYVMVFIIMDGLNISSLLIIDEYHFSSSIIYVHSEGSIIFKKMCVTRPDIPEPRVFRIKYY